MRGGVVLVIDENDLFAHPRAAVHQDRRGKVERDFLRLERLDRRDIQDQRVCIGAGEPERLGIRIADVELVVFDEADRFYGWDLDAVAVNAAKDDKRKGLWIDDELELLEIRQPDEAVGHEKFVVRFVGNELLLARD